MTCYFLPPHLPTCCKYLKKTSLLLLLIVDTLNQVSYIKTMQENMSQTTANMTRNQIIEEAIDTACTTWEVSADWNSTVRAAKESMSERGLKPSRQLVLYVAKLARLPIQLN